MSRWWTRAQGLRWPGTIRAEQDRKAHVERPSVMEAPAGVLRQVVGQMADGRLEVGEVVGRDVAGT